LAFKNSDINAKGRTKVHCGSRASGSRAECGTQNSVAWMWQRAENGRPCERGIAWLPQL